MYISDDEFNQIQIALIEGTAEINIYPNDKSDFTFGFELLIDDILINSFDTYTEACEWVIETVNI